ncbi:hypothetical protein [Phyllobacterium phragmitis]|uniref:hypothetical protein n=1 Tax=Phyllobacterium phragmitis TaxID=2670329 RepID=UPI0038B2FC63
MLDSRTGGDAACYLGLILVCTGLKILSRIVNGMRAHWLSAAVFLAFGPVLEATMNGATNSAATPIAMDASDVNIGHRCAIGDSCSSDRGMHASRGLPQFS